MKTKTDKNLSIDEHIIDDLYDVYSKTYLVGLEKHINKFKLNEKEKILFYTNMLSLKSIKNSKIKNFMKHVISNLILKTIANNKIDFLYLFKDDEFRNDFSLAIKNYPNLLKMDEEILTIITSSPEFKKNVLSSKKFKSKLEICDYNFFKSLPKNYGYLVAYYNERINNYNEKLKKLYNRFFKKHLTDSEQEELINLQNNMKSKQVIIETTNYYKVSSLEHCLKRIILDSNYFKVLKTISNKSKMDLLDIVEFAKKYDKSKIFNELTEEGFIYTPENIEKIKYLVKSEKIESINNINNLSNISIDKLKKMPKTYKKNIKIVLTGGPQADERNNRKQFFSDGDYRQIRRINTDGTIQMKTAEKIGHAKAIKESYKEIKFDDKCKTAFERAKSAATILSTITLIIEGDLCIMITPKKLTQSQFDSLNYLIHKSNRNTKINTVVCDFKKNEDIFVYDVDSLYGAISVKKEAKKTSSKSR